MPRKFCIVVFLSGVLTGALLMALLGILPPAHGASADPASPDCAERMAEQPETKEAAWSIHTLAPIHQAPTASTRPEMCNPEGGLCLARPN
jgi:hypothetical protein